MRRHRTVLLLSMIAAAAGCGLPLRKSMTTVRHEWPASGINKVQIVGMNGQIHAAVGPVERISMVAHVTVRGRDPEGEIARGVLDMDVQNGTLVIQEKHHQKGRPIIIVPFLTRGDTSVSYELTVPASMNLSLENVNGSMTVDGVGGKTDLESVNGTIEARKSAGELNARTVNGEVEATFQKDFRGAKLETVNGAIAISLPADASFNCDVSQVNGSFKSNFPLTVGGAAGGGEGSFNGGSYPLELSTVNGSVRVTKKDS
jgi:hypothetical protein